ncbi:TPA: membrane protein insertase YidC [Streptococcus equi subsp. zooepidemicus]|nr:membrane protein insertase YidC [Streptococcus equi subsp. zooepidemicus]
MKLKTNRILFSGLALSVLLTLTGCVGRDAKGHPEGIIWDYLGKPVSFLIDYFANSTALGYGLAIIVVTIIVRTIILPLGLYQSWKASYQSEKMAYLKPFFEPINQRIKNATSTEEKMAAQTELMAAQRENGVNPLGGIGCLPLLIQMPFFSAMYVAVQFTKGVSTSTFMGIDLGHRSVLLTAVIAALYFVQSWLSMMAVPEEQREQMKAMLYTMPIMMIVMSFYLPAGLGLYWLVGGFFSIIQQLITTYLLKPRLRKQIAEEFAKNPPKVYKSHQPRKDVTAEKQALSTSKRTKSNRNAGKQKKRS